MSTPALVLLEATSLLRRLLDESTYPVRAGEGCRSCNSNGPEHAPDCPWLATVTEAEKFLTKHR